MPLYDNVCTWYGSAFLYPHSQHQNLSYPTEHYYCEDHHYLTFRKRNYIETKHTGRDENGSLNIPGEYAYNIRKLNEPPHIKARHIIRKTIDERPEFEEICLHALIHHTRYGECKYCTEVNSDYLHDTIFVKERRLSDGKLTISKSKNLKNNDFAKKINARIQRETLKDDERRILKVGAKYKPKDVYKSIRTAKTREPIETSIPEISKLSSRNIKLKQRPKFISEKDFKKKFEKTETIKFQKQLVNCTFYFIQFFKHKG